MERMMSYITFALFIIGSILNGYLVSAEDPKVRFGICVYVGLTYGYFYAKSKMYESERAMNESLKGYCEKLFECIERAIKRSEDRLEMREKLYQQSETTNPPADS